MRNTLRFARWDGLVHEVWSWGTRETPKMKGTTVCAVHFKLDDVARTNDAPTCLLCVAKP